MLPTTMLRTKLRDWVERREAAKLSPRSASLEAAGDSNAARPKRGGYSHRLLNAAGIRLMQEESVKSALWCVHRRSSFVLTDRRLIYAQREGREATAHWAELSEVKNAGVSRTGRNHALLAVGAFCLLAGIVLTFVVGFWGLAPLLLIGAVLAGTWFVSEGKATVYASLGGQQMQGEISKRDRRRASEFVNLLFELKQD
ncbi:MAG: hypothetical protein BZY80_00150 [SAR202 cluster bacterium Io17-Chloro-G2]|nr:MAG: hypothetical protein BZY80_00150 [SAR202 cluster bacterium Io17-Chloro-G2]